MGSERTGEMPRLSPLLILLALLSARLVAGFHIGRPVQGLVVRMPLLAANEPVLTDLDDLESGLPLKEAQTKGSGVEVYLQEASKLIGKTPLQSLKQTVLKLSLPALGITIPDDFEEVAAMALDLAWKQSGGDWSMLLNWLNEELGPGCARADAAIKATTESLQSLTEAELKKLIVKHADEGVNALPKFDSRKYDGKYTKADYLAQLIDVVRVANGNDYEKVAQVLSREGKRSKGFSS